MKNLFLVLAFALISSSGFSQTFTSSSTTPGTTVQSYTVNPSHGYTYSYTIAATNSTVMIISQYKGSLALLSNYTSSPQQSSGSGSVPGSPNSNIQQDIIMLIIQNGSYYGYGYAQISVNPY